jgi:hypothetical protein
LFQDWVPNPFLPRGLVLGLLVFFFREPPLPTTTLHSIPK